MKATKGILIVGAGLAGTLMACYLARMGRRVRVFERRGDPRAAGYGGGRSINLALSARGFHALAGVGLVTLVMERDAIPMRGRMIHSPRGELVFQPYSADPNDAINSVSRAGLNLTLLDAADRFEGVEFIFDHPCVDVDPEAPAAVFERAGGRTVRVEADLVIGADGAFSAVRGRMQKTDRFEYSQSFLEHGYKELHIPPADARAGPESRPAHAMEPNALHIWPRGGAMMIALPNRDGSFTCTLFWPFEGEHGFAGLRTADEVPAFFREHYPDAVALMPTLTEDFFRNPTGSLATVRCWPWQIGGKVALIGDAAHAIVPFYGQGINAGFEDCRELAECLSRHADQGEALLEYQAKRKPNADAIADMALENFVEMRDRTAAGEFLYAKRVEQTLHRLFPDRAQPQYNLVSFSTIPYTEARRRGARLGAVVAAVVRALPPRSAERMSEDAWRARVAELGEALLSDRPSGPPELLDISPPITPALRVWPGDTPPMREVLLDIARGDSVTLSTLRTTVHAGAHADAPNHYAPRGAAPAPGIGERSLDHYIGPCHVLEARAGRGRRIGPGDLPLGSIRHPRVLIRTGTYPDPHDFNEDFAALSVELVDALAARGVITIGIDTPSVDLFASKDLEAHRAIFRHDMAILEGLALADIAPGEYELLAAPLKLMGFDASPVRAVLRYTSPEPRP